MTDNTKNFLIQFASLPFEERVTVMDCMAVVHGLAPVPLLTAAKKRRGRPVGSKNKQVASLVEDSGYTPSEARAIVKAGGLE